MTATDAAEQRQRAIAASIGHPFAFEQGGSLHVGILGMVARPSGPHDEAPFVVGVWDGERSQADLDLTHIHEVADGELPPQLDLWFDDDQTILDISDAFVGAPADALAGSGIPTAVLNGPVSVARGGDAGDGVLALLTQMCAGKLIVDPAAMMRLIASDDLEAFVEYEVEGVEAQQAFMATMSAASFLAEVGLTSTALINQIAVLGCELRHEIGSEVTSILDDYLWATDVQLSWLINDDGRIETSQVIIRLDEFLNTVFRRDDVVDMLAREEQSTAAEIREFLDSAAERGLLAYMNVLWQNYAYDSEVEPVTWPEALDLSLEVAVQASQLREPDRDDVVAAAFDESAVVWLPANISVDPEMLVMMQESSGAMQFLLSEVDGDAVAAMKAAQQAVLAIRHPDEPSDALASYVSDVVETETGARFWADISDMDEEEAVLEEVLEAVIIATGAVVTSAHLSSELP